MSVKVNLIPVFIRAAAMYRYIAKRWKEAIGKIKANKELRWWTKLAARYTLVILILIVYGLVACRMGQKKALETYNLWFEEYKAEQEEAARAAVESDPYTIQLNAEADAIARLLYGCRDNDTDDLKTYCWCVFNRVENAAFPSTLEDVIAQPQQWMRYDKTNPIIESLWQLAREQLDAWHTAERRPCSSDFVFMSWSSDDIVLRDNYHTGSNCHYWRFGQ